MPDLWIKVNTVDPEIFNKKVLIFIWFQAFKINNAIYFQI